MENVGLKLRMTVAGTFLFAFYAALALVLFRAGVGLPVVLAGSVLFVGVQYKLGKWLALRSVGAQDLSAGEYPYVHERVEHLSEEMGIEKPTLKVAEMGAPNAFAVGRRGAGVVVVSYSLLELLERDELEGVLAHELAHLKNRDVVIMVIGQSIASMIGILVTWAIALSDDSFAVTVAGWIVGTVAQMVVMVFVLAVSRYREYVADGTAAEYTDDPRAMARALGKIGRVSRSDAAADVEEGVSALCIAGGERGLLATLFATHPPIERRIARLAPEMAGGA